MNGRKSKERAKGQLAPELRGERRERIGIIAAARNEACNEAKAVYDAAVASARSAKNAAQNAAYDKFNEQRAAIRADIDKKQAERERDVEAAA